MSNNLNDHTAERGALLAWIDDQRQALPESRTPAAHGKAELLRDLRTQVDLIWPTSPERRPGFKKSSDECNHLVVDEHVVNDRVVASRCCDCGKRGV